MGTNYYVRGTQNTINEIHIGKASNDKFYWNISREQLNELMGNVPFCGCCGRTFDDKTNVIEDEYFHKFTLEEFEDEIKNLKPSYKLIGRDFS